MRKTRESVVSIARSMLGKNEKDGSHKSIIDIYNEGKPRGAYKMKYTDHWCATFVSSVSIKADVSDILPIECGCERMINLFKKKGEWVEDDAYTPSAGDVIFYDWDDKGVGDNTGWSDHVGIVEKVKGGIITVIEGNMSDKVGRRHIKVNAKYIRGYGVPKYSGEVPKVIVNKPIKKEDKNSGVKVGDIVWFAGKKHYSNSTKTGIAYPCVSGKAKVTIVKEGSEHPYHLIHIDSSSNVYGWVDAEDIVK